MRQTVDLAKSQKPVSQSHSGWGPVWPFGGRAPVDLRGIPKAAKSFQMLETVEMTKELWKMIDEKEKVHPKWKLHSASASVLQEEHELGREEKKAALGGTGAKSPNSFGFSQQDIFGLLFISKIFKFLSKIIHQKQIILNFSKLNPKVFKSVCFMVQLSCVLWYNFPRKEEPTEEDVAVADGEILPGEGSVAARLPRGSRAAGRREDATHEASPWFCWRVFHMVLI